jgi:hypothetical protein
MNILKPENYQEKINSYSKADWAPLLDLIPEIEKTEKFDETPEIDYLLENDRIRYTIHPEACKEILKRLLELNDKIHEEEVKAGLCEKKVCTSRRAKEGQKEPQFYKKGYGKSTKIKSEEPAGQYALFNSMNRNKFLKPPKPSEKPPK